MQEVPNPAENSYNMWHIQRRRPKTAAIPKFTVEIATHLDDAL
jgi:hypothetical protein